ncbi:phospholipase D-like domain-containing protein, partial [Escherichia coli]|uniref:phospholipase D-like domain-containing protein n=1 Tax=Escherichia coli TaxID=562 RepID=UPI00201FA2DD
AEFTIGEGELMAHDVPLGCAPDEYDDLISGTCSHLPWQKVEQTGFLASMALARSRGIDITVVTDKNCNIAHVDDDKRQEKQHLLNDAVEKLNKMGIATKLVNRVHSKIVIEDEELLCVGSFNWFSAAREDKYQRYDTSLVYRGEGVKNEIKAIYGSLDQRQL